MLRKILSCHAVSHTIVTQCRNCHPPSTLVNPVRGQGGSLEVLPEHLVPGGLAVAHLLQPVVDIVVEVACGIHVGVRVDLDGVHVGVAVRVGERLADVVAGDLASVAGGGAGMAKLASEALDGGVLVTRRFAHLEILGWHEAQLGCGDGRLLVVVETRAFDHLELFGGHDVQHGEAGVDAGGLLLARAAGEEARCRLASGVSRGRRGGVAVTVQLDAVAVVGPLGVAGLTSGAGGEQVLVADGGVVSGAGSALRGVVGSHLELS